MLMDETAIATQQKANIPQPTEHVVAPDGPPESVGYLDNGELDELTQFKLHDIFDVQYDPNDAETKNHLSYIYNQISEMVDSKDYTVVASKMRDIMRIAGIQHSERKVYKLYEWLRLSSISKKAHREMEALRDA